MSRRRPIFVTGAAESALGEVAGQSELEMVADAAHEALAEAGLELSDVDGLFVNYMGDEGAVEVAEYLGLDPTYSDSTDLGGAAFEAFVDHAWSAIDSGVCEVALIAYASRQRTRRLRSMSLGQPLDSLLGQLEVRVGLPMPIGTFALLAARHIAQYGTTEEQLAEIAVAARRWASLNPKAWSRNPISVSDVMASAPIADPLKRLDCCLVTDGGGAIVLTSAERARDAAKATVQVLGAATSHSHWLVSQMPDLTHTASLSSGRRALSMAGITTSDVDVFEPYDAFTIGVLLQLEDLGFCAPGEGGAFVENGRLAPGGALPSMTSGGGLSYCHPGAFGLLLLVEAVRQLRGEAGERQVPNAKIALVNGLGGLASVGSTVVLAR